MCDFCRCRLAVKEKDRNTLAQSENSSLGETIINEGVCLQRIHVGCEYPYLYVSVCYVVTQYDPLLCTQCVFSYPIKYLAGVLTADDAGFERITKFSLSTHRASLTVNHPLFTFHPADSSLI